MTSSPGPSPESRLVRALGVWGLAASIVNVTVGGGIFGLPARVAAQLGAAAPLAYLVCSVAMALIVLCIAEAGSRVALTGGPYAYVEIAFGPFAGFLSGVLLWLLGTAAVAAVSTLFLASLARLLPGSPIAGGLPRALVLVTTFALLAAVNIRGVRQGTRVNVVFTIAKLVPLALFIIVGAFFVRAEHLRWVDTPSLGEVSGASVLLIFAFSGIEGALVPSGEVRDPARTVPRAVFIAMTSVMLLYIAIQLVAQGILGPGITEHPDTPLAEAAGAALGPAARSFMLAGAAISMFGYVSGMTLAVPRALYAYARDGFLPAGLAAVHARFHTPHVAIAVQSAAVCALAVSGTFQFLAIVSNVAVLLLYAGCCLAAWQLRRRDVRAGGVPFRVPAAGVVPIAGCLAILFILSSLPLRELAVVGGALAAASVIYQLTRARRARIVAPSR